MLDLACCVPLFLKSNSHWTCKMQRILFPCRFSRAYTWTYAVSFSKNTGLRSQSSQQAVRLSRFVPLHLLPNDGNTPYSVLSASSSDRFRSSLKGLPKPGFCIRVNINETGERTVPSQENGSHFAARLLRTVSDPIPVSSKGARPIGHCLVRCAYLWHMDRNSYSELHPRSFFQITLLFEKRTLGTICFLEHKLSGYPKICIQFTKCWNGSSFPISTFLCCLSDPFTKERCFSYEKTHTNGFLIHTDLGMNTTIPDMPSAVKPLWTGTKRNELGKALPGNNGTLIDVFFYGTRNRFLPISATASSSPQTLSCFRKIFAIRLQRGNCRSDKCDT